MARAYCQQCQRPASACICHLVVPTDNDVDVVILQHAKEVNHPKGSATLLSQSLSRCQLFIGENFDEHIEFQQWLSATNKKLFVCFPAEQASALDTLTALPKEEIVLIILDGTWKKAYKMFQLSMCLQQLPQVVLPEGLAGNYAIRKTTKANALSTLEACCYALQIIEQAPKRYNTLLKSFAQFNQIQLSFRKS